MEDSLLFIMCHSLPIVLQTPADLHGGSNTVKKHKLKAIPQ